jgi:dienelactone hydrolase
MKAKIPSVSAFVVLAVHIVAFAGGHPVPYEVDGGAFEGYYTEPYPGAPLVLLVHDWDGLTDYEVKRAGMLADLGYAVFAADLFGAGVRPTEIAEKRRLTGELYADRQKMRARLWGALAAAEAQNADVGNAAAIGYCFGGTAVLELARSGAGLKGFVTFHGGLTIPEGQDHSEVSARLLVLHGTADESVSMGDFAALAVALEEAGVPHEMITYGGAPHAFTVFGSDRYREEADRESWKRLESFLGDILAIPADEPADDSTDQPD